MEMPIRFVGREARNADIIVIGQSRDSAFTDPFARVNPSDLVMQAGRPLLVVPEAAGWLDLRSVLVAWKDTPEARRAIVDLLPLLRKAKDVTIAEIVEDGGSREAALKRTVDVVTWLSHHDIAANALFRKRVRHGMLPLHWMNCGRRCSRRGCCGSLRPFAVARVGTRWRDAAPCN